VSASALPVPAAVTTRSQPNNRRMPTMVTTPIPRTCARDGCDEDISDKRRGTRYCSPRCAEQDRYHRTKTPASRRPGRPPQGEHPKLASAFRQARRVQAQWYAERDAMEAQAEAERRARGMPRLQAQAALPCPPTLSRALAGRPDPRAPSPPRFPSLQPRFPRQLLGLRPHPPPLLPVVHVRAPPGHRPFASAARLRSYSTLGAPLNRLASAA
jgi:hypothetical protein